MINIYIVTHSTSILCKVKKKLNVNPHLEDRYDKLSFRLVKYYEYDTVPLMYFLTAQK